MIHEPETQSQADTPIDDTTGDQAEDLDLVSKSQLKRDSKALQNLGKKISGLNDEQLAGLPLDDKLRDAVYLARKLTNKRGAQKRHFQYMGKLLRNIDAEPIIAAVQKLEDRHHASQQRFHQIENWRDRIVEQGENAIDEFCTFYPQAERQHLRQLWRNHQHANDHKKTVIARHLFQDLRDIIEQQA